jgi:hypothetical protein
MLNDTRKSSELPTPKDLLDGYPKKDINTLLIAGNFMKLKVIRWQHRDAFQLLVGFPLPFTNIKVNNEVYFGFDNPVLDDDYYSNIRVLPTKIIDGDNNISSMNSNFKYLNDYYWYNIAIGIKVPRDRDYMRVELGLINDNNEDDISVYYNYIKIEDLYLESDDPLNTVIESPTKVTVTNKTTRLKGNTTKELSIDMMYGTFEETENDTNDMEF